MRGHILVIGAGFLGSHVIDRFEKNDFKVTSTSLSGKKDSIKLDITNFKDTAKLIEKLKPNLIVNCASPTNIDDLEDNPQLAFSVNHYAVENIAKIVNEFAIRLVHISTDSVFDGVKGRYSENDLPHPINVYSKSKFEAEKAIQKICRNYVIIRTNFYGVDKDKRFLFSKILDELQHGRSVIGFDDIVFNPLEITNLSQMIKEITTTNFTGIINLASDEILTKYEFCKKIAKFFGLDLNLVKKGSSVDMNFIAQRSKNTSLLNALAKQIIKTPILKYEDWLHDVSKKNL